MVPPLAPVKPDKEAGPLREGLIDLEIGLRGTRAEDHRRRARLSGCHADRAPLGPGGAGAGVPDLGDVASPPGRRSGASLAARDGGDGLPTGLFRTLKEGRYQEPHGQTLP